MIHLALLIASFLFLLGLAFALVFVLVGVGYAICQRFKLLFKSLVGFAESGSYRRVWFWVFILFTCIR